MFDNLQGTTTLTPEMLQRAIDSCWEQSHKPTIMVMSKRASDLYSFLLRRFNIWASYSPRLIVPMWLPHVAWGRPLRWARRRWHHYQMMRRWPDE